MVFGSPMGGTGVIVHCSLIQVVAARNLRAMSSSVTRVVEGGSLDSIAS